MSKTVDEVLKNARKACSEVHQSAKAADVDGFEASSFQLTAAFEELDRWMGEGGLPPKDWDHKCGAPHRDERIECLMRPGHRGPHRHFTETSSHAWS